MKNGNTVDIPVGDLVEGLVNSTDLQNALDTKVDKVSGKGLSTNDLTNELVSKINSALQEHQPLDNYATLEQVNAKYTKPSTGIPKTDLESSVQSSLNKADTALQEHQDISGKVDKVEGKGLSTNDYTNTDKSKLDGLANIKIIGDNLTLDEQGKLSATGVSSINGQTGAITGIATTAYVENLIGTISQTLGNTEDLEV